jgi:thioesterase domain-containing protein
MLPFIRSKLRRKAQRRVASASAPADPLELSYEDYTRSLECYPGRITLFRAAIQPPGIRFAFDDPTNGWRAIALSGVEVIRVPGTHFTMLQPPNLTVLARALKACLRKGFSSDVKRNGS